ncbi:hypothetical protein C2S52_005533 [Perilla frutescens var. hirtella]|nr:hypothetical protein C2S52_005533 [Perilla frutescens var. hirtella]
MNLWSLWNHLYCVKHSNGGSLPVFSFEKGEHIFSAYHKARHQIEVISRLQALAGDKQWSCPPEGCCRVDVDALFNPVLRLYSLGVVIRNSTDFVVAALAKPIKHPTSVLGVEILAAISGINLCLEEGITHVLLFSNSILTVQVLSDSNVDDRIVVDEL